MLQIIKLKKLLDGMVYMDMDILIMDIHMDMDMDILIMDMDMDYIIEK